MHLAAACWIHQERWSFNNAVLKGGSPKLGESQGLGESLRLSPISGESLKLSPKTGESFRGELFNMKSCDIFLLVFKTAP